MPDPQATRARLFLDQRMEHPERLGCSHGTATVFSARSPDRNGDSANQDSAAALPFGGASCVLAVADGAGGMPAGGRASAIAVQSLASAVRSTTSNGGSMRDAILDGIERANQEIQALGVGAATTFVCVEIDGQTLRSYHVGDSTILVVGQRGKIKLLTMSHSPVGYAVQAGMLTPEDALHHEDLSVVSNLVGAPDMRIEIGPPIQLSPRDTVVLGSDGLFDNLHLEEIIEIIRAGPLEGAADKLRSVCSDRMTSPKEGLPSKPDDLTFVLYRPNSPARVSP